MSVTAALCFRHRYSLSHAANCLLYFLFSNQSHKEKSDHGALPSFIYDTCMTPARSTSAVEADALLRTTLAKFVL